MSGFFHITKRFRGPSISHHGSAVYLLSSLQNIPLYGHTTFFYSSRACCLLELYPVLVCYEQCSSGHPCTSLCVGGRLKIWNENICPNSQLFRMLYSSRRRIYMPASISCSHPLSTKAWSAEKCAESYSQAVTVTVMLSWQAPVSVRHEIPAYLNPPLKKRK